MTTLKASLKAARDAISSKDYETAIKHSQDAIKADDKSYEAHMWDIFPFHQQIAQIGPIIYSVSFTKGN